MLVTASSHSIAAIRHSLSLQPETSLQTAQVDATCGVEIDLHVRHDTAPNPGYLHTGMTGATRRTAARTCHNIPLFTAVVHPQQPLAQLVSCDLPGAFAARNQQRCDTSNCDCVAGCFVVL